MKKKFRVVIVGGVAAGPKVASKVIRLCPDAEVTVKRASYFPTQGVGYPTMCPEWSRTKRN